MSNTPTPSSGFMSAVVRQPFLILLAVLVLSVIGAIIVVDLPIEAFPDVQDTQVQVITQAPGRAPEEVERSISQPLERELGGTPRATRIRSVSITGLSVITATFEDGTNDFFARAQVLERIQNASLAVRALDPDRPTALAKKLSAFIFYSAKQMTDVKFFSVTGARMKIKSQTPSPMTNGLP